MPALRSNQYDGLFRGDYRQTHPTAENSFASSYSVKEMPFLCSAIASAKPLIPAPAACVSWIIYSCKTVGRHADNGDAKSVSCSW
jgi:hypothetical protein